MTGAQALVEATRRLNAAGVPDPARDARILLAEALEIDRARLTLVCGDELTTQSAEKFTRMIDARVSRQPVSQIIGRREFYGREFIVTPDVLDPRPDTELLIDIALSQPFETVLDIGLGSGCILLTLLKEIDESTGVGSDVSKAAIDVASKNVSALNLSEKAELIESNWFQSLPERKFDLIVSNPPYIAESVMQDLSPEVRDWEPQLALTPGGDGLGPYKIIAETAPRYLNPNGRLIVEIGFDQGVRVREFFEMSGFSDVLVAKDLAGHDRVVSGVFGAISGF